MRHKAALAEHIRANPDISTLIVGALLSATLAISYFLIVPAAGVAPTASSGARAGEPAASTGTPSPLPSPTPTAAKKRTSSPGRAVNPISLTPGDRNGPAAEPTAGPSPKPSAEPSPDPSGEPSSKPSADPSTSPDPDAGTQPDDDETPEPTSAADEAASCDVGGVSVDPLVDVCL